MEQNNFNFSFTLEEANIILGALGEMPFKTVHSVIGKIQSQANIQLAEQASRKVPVTTDSDVASSDQPDEKLPPLPGKKA